MLFVPHSASSLWLKLLDAGTRVFEKASLVVPACIKYILNAPNNIRESVDMFLHNAQYRLVTVLIVAVPLSIIAFFWAFFYYESEVEAALANMVQATDPKSLFGPNAWIYIGAVAFTVVVISLCIYAITTYYRDSRIFSGLSRDVHRLENRADIYLHYEQLHTVRYRLKFLEWLEERVAHNEPLRKRLASPDDYWPGGVPPYHGNDDASRKLALLEERWLNLDR